MSGTGGWVRLRKALAALVAVAAGVIVNAFGFADLSIGWLLAGTLVLAGAAWFVGHATEPGLAKSARLSALWSCVALLTIFLAGSGAYNLWFDPANKSVGPWEFVVATDDEAQTIRLSGEPGGPALMLNSYGPLGGGQSYEFDCRITLDNGDRWLRLANTTSWAPESLLRPRAGESADEMPSC